MVDGTYRAGATAGDSAQNGTRHAYLFLTQPGADIAFLGCSPEKLFKLEGDQLTAEALAGTRGRGDSADADRRLANEVRRRQR